MWYLSPQSLEAMEEKDNHIITQINVNCNCGKCMMVIPNLEDWSIP